MHVFFKQTNFNNFLKCISYTLLVYLFSQFFRGLGNYSLNYDELFTHFIVSQKSIKNFMYAVFYREQTPPLYYTLLKLFDPFVVWNEFSLRFFSAASISATVYVVHSYIKKQYSIFFAICFLMLIVANNPMLTISKLARGYALASFFATLGYIYFLNIVSNIEPMKNFKKMLLATFFLSFTHYAGLVFSLSLLILAFIHKHKVIINYIYKNKLVTLLAVLPLTVFVYFHNILYFSKPFEFSAIIVNSNLTTWVNFSNFLYSTNFIIMFLSLLIIVIIQYLHFPGGIRKDFYRIVYSLALIFVFVFILHSIFSIFKITNYQRQYVLFVAHISIIIFVMILAIFFKMCRSFFLSPYRKVFYSHFLILCICTYILLSNQNSERGLFFKSDYRTAFALLSEEIKNKSQPYIFAESLTPIDTLAYYSDLYRINFNTVIDSNASSSNKIKKINSFIESQKPREFYIFKSTIGFLNEDSIKYIFANYNLKIVFKDTYIELIKYVEKVK